MTAQKLNEARGRLLALREKLQETGDMADDSAKPVKLDQCVVGRLSRMDALQQQAMSVEQNRRRKEGIKRVNAALNRIEKGRVRLVPGLRRGDQRKTAGDRPRCALLHSLCG